MVKVLIVIAILALIAFVAFGQYVGVRNTLVTKNEAVKASWSQVDIVLQRRADLIPNLVATVKGIAQQEQTVFGDIAKARSALLSAGNPTDKIAANQQLDGALGRLLAIVENYPQLKSNENFLRLQDELAGTENRIAVERKRYNDTLQDYNTYIQKFPNNIFAGWAGFKPNEAYFAASEGSRQVPTVNFAPSPLPNPRHPRPHRSPLPRTSVEADFAVELGADDETLELPWAAEDGGPRYYDLKRQPELLLNVEEASRVPELAEFLAVMNSPGGILETAKCDTWSSTEINPEEEIFGAANKFCSYVDILFSQESARCSFADHEQFAKRVTQLLKRVPEIPAAVEFLIRRCFLPRGRRNS